MPRLRIEPATLRMWNKHYRFAIKAGLYRKAVQNLCYIPNTTTHFPSIFRFDPESHFELPRTYKRHGCAPSPSDGLFTLGARYNRWKNSKHSGFFPGPQNVYIFEPPKYQQNQQNDCAPSIRPVWSVFAVRMKKAWVLRYPLSARRRLWSDRADAQGDLSLRWVHMSLCWLWGGSFLVCTNLNFPQNHSRCQLVSVGTCAP